MAGWRRHAGTKKAAPPREPGLVIQAQLQSEYQFELLLRRANELGLNPGTLARILILEHIGFRDPEPNLPAASSTLRLQVPFQNRRQMEAALAYATRHGMSISSFLRGAILPKVGWDPDDDPKFK